MAHPWLRPALLVVILLLAGLAQPALHAADPIDWTRARQLYDRSRRGETLTPEEQAYLDRAKAERAQSRPAAPAGPNAPPPPPAGESTGLVPLTDLASDQKYKTRDGGLYGGGHNDLPEPHKKLAMAAIANITPRNAAGQPDPAGKIVLLSIGMSNTTQEFSRFKEMADRSPLKSPRVLIVDAAQGGRDAAAWVAEPAAKTTWAEADRRLAAGGGTAAQVQAVWIKQALIGPGRIGEFPAHIKPLQDDLVQILQAAHARYPNLKVAYLSSRIYAGYAVTPLNPEPYAYESAFAVRGVIQDQMAGNAALNADPAQGAVRAPVAVWGPYLWADGVRGRKVDELVWKRADLRDDGTHPSDSGRAKVAELLLKFFTTDATAKPWFATPADPPK